ncbi:MAG: hypothetical protein IJ600_08485 [Lachnospiraceae bacterium]|nr:hypothetical protein [Lachnospiraceae bacterium]
MSDMKRICICLVGSLLWLAACGKREEAVSEPTVSLAEEIAGGVSMNVIPAEALEYYTLAYTIPEGFRRTEGSTDTRDVYASETEGDYSYITYIRRENDGQRDYEKLSEADYKASIDESLSVNTVVESMEMSRGDSYLHVKVLASYSGERGRVELTEHVFVTEKYVFEMVYAMDPAFHRAETYAESEEGLHLLNVAEKTGN